MNVDMAMRYLDFVVDRHRVWEARQRGDAPPWSSDPILQERKFTNVFRVLDHGSQFLLRELLSGDLEPRDALARCFLYRFTNRPQTWTYLRSELGRYPLADDMTPALGDLLVQYRESGGQVFSGAYIVMPEPGVPGVDKARSVVNLTRVVVDSSYEDFMEQSTQRGRLAVLTEWNGVGDFMAMQILTDFGYYSGADEDEFVVPGPGSRAGARALEMPAMAAIQWAHRTLRTMDDCPVLPVQRVDGSTGLRYPSLMDVQNTLCEFSKYVRFMGRPSTGRPYVPAHPGPQDRPTLPSHW